MRRAISRSIAVLLALTLLWQAAPAAAWNQASHRQINLEAVRLFMRLSAGSSRQKYAWGPISPQGYSEPLRGIAVTSSSLLVDPYTPPGYAGPLQLIHLNGYTLGLDASPMDAWISAGGDWADEPHLYASVRHFYDPLARWGQAYLTDQYQFHGWYDAPQIDARTWALSHPDNPFNWQEALRHYKAALELDDEGWAPGNALVPQHFKTDIALNPVSADDERRMHLALAYRALGETMHLLGDMHQPAHVRNDSHPLDEPIESNTFAETVSASAAGPVDGRIAPSLASAGGTLQPPEELFRQVALFINAHFYTADTIYDGPSNVIPANTSAQDVATGTKPPYEHPQFADLLPRSVSVNTWRGPRTVTYYNADIAGREVPLAAERLSVVWFAGDLLPDVQGASSGWSLRPYQVPPSFAGAQAEVLMPVAIHACADLMDLFYPTLRLAAEYEDLREQENSPSVIRITAEMTHLIAEDKAWSEQGLSIAYTGPAVLEMTAEGEAPVVRKLHFMNGALARIESHLGEMVEAPLVVYVEAPDTTLPEAEAFYRATPGTQLQIRIEAGSREFASEPYLIAPEEATVAIEAPRLVLLELREGATEAEHRMSAYALPEGDYEYLWAYGDGESESDTPAAGESSAVSHTYRNLGAGDAFYPTVSLYDPATAQLLAEDSITIRVEGSQTESWDCGWPVDYASLSKTTGDRFLAYSSGPLGAWTGPYFEWWDTEQTRLRAVTCYKEGLKHGRLVEWYENGQISVDERWNMDQRDGLQTFWYEDGTKQREMMFSNGMAHGPFRRWGPNGQLMEEGAHTNNAYSGIWYYWKPDGSCDWIKNHDTGETIPCP